MAAGRSLVPFCRIAALGALIGCDSQPRDSSPAVDVVSVETTYLVDIGDDADGPHAMFSGFIAPVVLSDGSIVVANGGSRELRFFDTTGTWIRSAGRRGSGPGEFNSLGWLDVGLADTLLAYDFGLQRVSVFSRDGRFQRGYMLGQDGEGGSMRPQAALSDGSIVAITQASVDMNSEPGVRRDTSLLLRYDADGRLVDTLDRFPGSEYWIERTERSVSAQDRPFGKRLTVKAHGSAVYVGTADAHELTVLDDDGRNRRAIRWSGPDVPISSDQVDAYISATAAEAPVELRAEVGTRLRRAPFPATMPAFGSFFVADDGAIWIGRYLPAGSSERQTFDILGPTGVALGSVAMPERFTPAQISGNRLIGVWRDADDVVHVRVYRVAPQP